MISSLKSKMQKAGKNVTPTNTRRKKNLENAELMTFPKPIKELRPQVKQLSRNLKKELLGCFTPKE